MSDHRSRTSPSLTAISVAVAFALIVGACSGAASPAASIEPGATTEPAASTSAVPGGAMCQDVAALEDAITALSAVDVKTGGAEALGAAVDDVKTAAEALKSSASSELSSAVATFTADVDALKTAAGQLGQGGAGSGLVAVGTAIGALVSSAQALEEKFQTACP